MAQSQRHLRSGVKEHFGELGLANLNDIVIKLLEFDIVNQKAFLNDINENKESKENNYICENISKINVDFLNAWKLVQEARPNFQYRKDWAVLQETKTILNNSNSLSTLGGEESLNTIISQNTTAPCSVCNSNNMKLVMLNDYLNYINYFVTNYSASKHKGFNDVVGKKGILNKSLHQVNATAFVLRVLKENPAYLQTISGFEEKIEIDDEGKTNKAFADIVENENKIIECKSWELEGIAFQNFVNQGEPTGSVKQFITYLSDKEKVTSMDQIEYWFDKKKIGSSDTKLVKEKFKQMMIKDDALTTKGKAVFDAIWGNVGLRTSIWDPNQYTNLNIVQAQILFTTIVSDINNDNNQFYNFINIK